MRLPDDDPARALFHKAMGHILGEMLEEDSTIRDTVRSSPYSDVLVREVHKILGISHDQQWVRSEKIRWKDIKAKYPLSYNSSAGKDSDKEASEEDVNHLFGRDRG